MLKPMHDKVLIKIEEEKKQTKGGIFIPDNKIAEKYRVGEVLAVGAKVVELKVGDKVAVNRFKSDEHYIDGELHQLTKEDDIMFVFDGDLDINEALQDF